VLKRLLCMLKKNERGAAFIEFALVAPFLIFLVMGIIEFGWIFNGYIVLTGAAREGARLAVMGEDIALIEEAIERHAEFFTSQQGGSVQMVPLDSNYPDSYPIDGPIKITVNGQLPALIGFYIPEERNPVQLKAEVTVKRAY
jgi:hypothetical protein